MLVHFPDLVWTWLDIYHQKKNANHSINHSLENPCQFSLLPFNVPMSLTQVNNFTSQNTRIAGVPLPRVTATNVSSDQN